MSDDIDLPNEWSDAKPIVAAWIAGTVHRRSEIDTKIDGLRDHLDTRLDTIERSMGETVSEQREHAEQLHRHTGELGRLHDQQLNVIAANNALLTNFGTILGDLSDRVRKSEYVAGGILFGIILGLGILSLVAFNVWH